MIDKKARLFKICNKDFLYICLGYLSLLILPIFLFIFQQKELEQVSIFLKGPMFLLPLVHIFIGFYLLLETTKRRDFTLGVIFVSQVWFYGGYIWYEYEKISLTKIILIGLLTYFIFFFLSLGNLLTVREDIAKYRKGLTKWGFDDKA